MKKRIRKHHRRKSDHKTLSSIGKVSAILAAAAGVGLLVMGPQRYSAIATELFPKLSFTPGAHSIRNEVSPQLHRFSMSVKGGHATIPGFAAYQQVEAELTTRNNNPRVILRLQQVGDHQPLYEYERAISSDEFTEIWQQLQALGVAQLRDASPYTETKGNAGRVALRPAPSATYQFEFKDGVYDYPNSFEVHAPEQLSDDRYQAVRDVMFGVIVGRFGEILSQ